MPADPPPGVAVHYSQQYRRCGKDDCTICHAGAPGHGPYWFARWSEGGRKRSRYLGRDAPSGLLLPGQQARPTLQVRTLGGFAVWRGGTALPPECWTRRMATRLFKLLLTAPGHRLAREQVIDTLWPDALPEAGRHNLRNTVSRLHAILADPADPTGAPYLRTAGDALWLAPSQGEAAAANWLDADTFAVAVAAALAGQEIAACRAAVALYTGAYLPEDRYEEWAIRRRDTLQGQYLTLLLHLAALCRTSGDLEDAERALQAILRLDPCHEAAARTLMRLQVTGGRPLQASRTYRQLVIALREDLDLAPDAQTRAVHREVLVATRAAPDPLPVHPDVPPSNLPLPLTSFIGRRGELALLREVLRGEDAPLHRDDEQEPDRRPRAVCRLLTLTGAGGCGKTRLALALADEVLEQFSDGVWLVELAALTTAATVTPTVAATLGLPRQVPAGSPERALTDALIAFLKPRRLLLVLDNCEHLLATCAELSEVLLQACPRLRILATSREPLGIAGERPWRVPPLALPEGTRIPPVGQLPRYEALRLFVERARVHQPAFSLTGETAAAVVEVCRRLDGLPLAIELAAARAGVLTVQAIAARLTDRFRLLTRGSRTALPRHQTLRTALDWSHDLLSPAEQVLLRRLSVFAGGWRLDAADMITGADDQDQAAETSRRVTEISSVAPSAMTGLDVLSGLVAKSLVEVDEGRGERRYRLLETVRQYAGERLVTSGEANRLADRHLQWALALAEQAEPALWGPEQTTWLDRLESEHDNLRAALAWSTAASPASHVTAPAERWTTGLALAGLLWRFWWLHGHLSEGRAQLAQVLACGDRAPAALRARALNGAGNLAQEQGDYAQAAALHEESLALRRALGDTHGIAASLGNLGLLAYYQGHYTQAIALHEESLALRRALGDPRGIAYALSNLARVAVDHGDCQLAAHRLEECLTLFRALGDVRGVAGILSDLATVAHAQGHYEQAVAGLEESLLLSSDLGDQRGRATCLHNLAIIAADQADTPRARALQKESLLLFGDLGDQRGIRACLERLAWLAVQEAAAGSAERAAQLFGAADALRLAGGVILPPTEQRAHEQTVAVVVATLGRDACARAWTAGGALSLADAVGLALVGTP